MDFPLRNMAIFIAVMGGSLWWFFFASCLASSHIVQQFLQLVGPVGLALFVHTTWDGLFCWLQNAGIQVSENIVDVCPLHLEVFGELVGVVTD